MSLKLVAIALSLTCVTGHVALWNNPNQLHPVQGLYVKPSEDGTTGDLYVAATEDNGVKTQWLTDQPINFLPAGAQQAAFPISYLSSFTAANQPHDETVVSTQKRAVITSPSFKYTYALPGTSDGNTIPYPYAVAPATTEGATETAEPVAASYPHYPFHYYYPQMMTAFANAMSALKEAGGVSDEAAGSVAPQAAMWPQSYTYPVQYVMVDPAAWAQSQASQASATQTTTPKTVESESNENA